MCFRFAISRFDAPLGVCLAVRSWAVVAFFVVVGLCGKRGLGAQDAVLVLSPGPMVSTLAGTGRAGFAGDGGMAAAARLGSPSAVAYDASGGLVFADTRNHVVRRVGADGTIQTVAGTGRQGFAGDGGPALAAEMDSPLGVAVGADGSLYVADTRNHRVRKVGADGVIATVAGTGIAGFGGDLGAATRAMLRSPGAVLVGPVGEVYVADTGNHRVRRIALDGTIATVAGSGLESAAGDGGPATAAGLDAPSGLAMRADGALLIADRLNSRIRVVTSDGSIQSLPRRAVPVRRAAGVSVDAAGTVYVADTGDYQVRAVAGNGSGVVLGSGLQGGVDASAGAGQTAMGAPFAVAADANGGFAVADRDHHQVQHLALPEVNFGETPVGQQSVAKTLELRNAGAAALNVSGVHMPVGFAVAGGGSCGGTPFVVAAGAHCTLLLAFAPASAGAQSGVVEIGVEGGLAQRALVMGSAVPGGSVVPSSTTLESGGDVSYVGVAVTLTARVLASSTAVPTGTVRLMDASVEIGSVALGAGGAAQFTVASLTAGQHTLVAQYSGDAHYAASASGSLQQTVAPAPDFSIAATVPRVAVTAGGAGSVPLTLQPMNGTLNRAVSLGFDGLPAGATVTVTPMPLTLGSDAVTVTLGIKTAASSALVHAVSLVSAGLVLGWGVGVRRRCRVRMRFVPILCGLLLGALMGVAGCSGGFLSGSSTTGQTVSHTYPVTVTATTTGVTGDPLVHTATFTLVVN